MKNRTEILETLRQINERMSAMESRLDGKSPKPKPPPGSVHITAIGMAGGRPVEKQRKEWNIPDCEFKAMVNKLEPILRGHTTGFINGEGKRIVWRKVIGRPLSDVLKEHFKNGLNEKKAMERLLTDLPEMSEINKKSLKSSIYERYSDFRNGTKYYPKLRFGGKTKKYAKHRKRNTPTRWAEIFGKHMKDFAIEGCARGQSFDEILKTVENTHPETFKINKKKIIMALRPRYYENRKKETGG